MYIRKYVYTPRIRVYFIQIAQQMTVPTPLPNYEEKKDFVYKYVYMYVCMYICT